MDIHIPMLLPYFWHVCNGCVFVGVGVTLGYMTTEHGRRNRVGGRGGGYNQYIPIRLRYVHSSVDIENHRYTNVQNCILLKY